MIKTLWFSEISWHPVAFSPQGQWLALASRDVQLWLKAMLTEEEYAEVKAGEERAMLMKQETDSACARACGVETTGKGRSGSRNIDSATARGGRV